MPLLRRWIAGAMIAPFVIALLLVGLMAPFAGAQHGPWAWAAYCTLLTFIVTSPSMMALVLALALLSALMPRGARFRRSRSRP